jgi:putative phosphoserine phosphatase/1-acylglycerol-3-phosphate O-acyltransferase
VSGIGLQSALAEIEASPSGAKVGAFVDLDGTILSGFSATASLSQGLRRGDVTVSELAKNVALALDGKRGGDPKAAAVVELEALRGQSEDDMSELGEQIFVQKVGQMIRPEVRELVRAHQRKGHTVVGVSSATRFHAEPTAHNLSIDHIVCSGVELEGGLLTGRFDDGGFLWGEGKARAVREFARRRGITLARSYAYGNGTEDAAFLATTGHPVAVNPQAGLRRTADQQQWPILTVKDPGRRGLREALATVAALGGLNIGLATGLGIGVLQRNPRLGADLGVSLGLQSYLALVGVTLDVVGRHNMFAQRPCVFVVNHQSALDALIVVTLAQGGLSAMGKKEAQYLPPTYLLSRALNTVWVDRTDSAAARLSQHELVERLRDGYSVMVAPEGTRQPTPVLGPFRTGAFHVAIDAAVPIVPVIVRNAYDLQPGSALTANSGVVQVAVLEPVPTDSWSKATIRDHVADVRQRFVDTMNDWPEGEQ